MEVLRAVWVIWAHCSSSCASYEHDSVVHFTLLSRIFRADTLRIEDDLGGVVQLLLVRVVVVFRLHKLVWILVWISQLIIKMSVSISKSLSQVSLIWCDNLVTTLAMWWACCLGVCYFIEHSVHIVFAKHSLVLVISQFNSRSIICTV